MEELNEGHAAVLDAISDGAAPLWELPWPSKSWDDKSLIRDAAAVSVEEAQSALRDLVARGAVEIYEERDEGASRLLARAETEEAISVAANWLPPAESGRSTWYSAVLTQAGEEVYRHAAEAFGWSK